MCNKACIDFGKTVLKEENVRGRSVIEVGALDVNGSLRSVVESLSPSSYIGVDMQKGRGVDRICKVEDLIETFGKDTFDVVISTELLEHVLDWAGAIHNLKQILKPGGILLVTTRSRGCVYHGFPFDFWRYEIVDVQQIFSDFSIDVVTSDPDLPGIFLLARKPQVYQENDAHDRKLYSVVVDEPATIRKNRLYWKVVFLPLFMILRRPGISLRISAKIASLGKTLFGTRSPSCFG